MSEAKPELPDLDELISASAHETFPTEETNADTPHPKLNHQWVVLLSWVTCACIAEVLYSYPVHDESIWVSEVKTSDLVLRCTT